MVSVRLEGRNVYCERVKYRTGTIDMKDIVQLYLKAAVSMDQEMKEEQLRKIWKCFGLDTMN